MTLKGKQNHFNVKFLKGYGFSVKLHDKKIQLKNNYDPFSEPQIEEHFINKLPYEKIVLQGNGYISTEALKLLTENGRQNPRLPSQSGSGIEPASIAALILSLTSSISPASIKSQPGSSLPE